VLSYIGVAWLLAVISVVMDAARTAAQEQRSKNDTGERRMITNLHILRKALICISLVIMLTAELTLLGAAASAQDNQTGLQSAPAAGSAGNATVPTVPNDSAMAMQPSPPSEAGNAAQTGITATLLGVPVNGTAPLTVGFYVGLANFRGSLAYQWDFGDGAISLLPAGVFMLHVYQQPGTYLCELNLTTSQGNSTTLFTTITVQPAHS
jgi:hypothetical protein